MIDSMEAVRGQRRIVSASWTYDVTDKVGMLFFERTVIKYKSCIKCICVKATLLNQLKETKP